MPTKEIKKNKMILMPTHPSKCQFCAEQLDKDFKEKSWLAFYDLSLKKREYAVNDMHIFLNPINKHEFNNTKALFSFTCQQLEEGDAMLEKFYKVVLRKKENFKKVTFGSRKSAAEKAFELLKEEMMQGAKIEYYFFYSFNKLKGKEEKEVIFPDNSLKKYADWIEGSLRIKDAESDSR